MNLDYIILAEDLISDVGDLRDRWRLVCSDEFSVEYEHEGISIQFDLRIPKGGIGTPSYKIWKQIAHSDINLYSNVQAFNDLCKEKRVPKIQLGDGVMNGFVEVYMLSTLKFEYGHYYMDDVLKDIDRAYNAIKMFVYPYVKV